MRWTGLIARLVESVLKYRAIQEERSVFWMVIVLVLVRKKVHMNICLIVNGYRGRAMWISRPNSVRFLFVGLNEGRTLWKKGWYTRGTARSQFWMLLPAWRNVKINSEEQDAIFAQVAKCTEFDVGIFEYLFWTVTNLSFLCNKFNI